MRRTQEQMEKERLELEKMFNRGWGNAFYIITLFIKSNKTFREFFTEKGAEKDMNDIELWKSLAVALDRENEMLEFLYGDEVKEIKKRVDEEAAEDIIEEHVGIRLDLTPSSPEPETNKSP